MILGSDFSLESGVAARGVLTGDVCVTWSDFCGGGAGGRLPLLFLRRRASRIMVCRPGWDTQLSASLVDALKVYR